ncbi:MAG: beta-propeller domain-containing protein [Polyangiaceae bacterium]|nr:beta-propeller domain-containing protein [Polyangiaceae bacterium]
MTRRVHQRHCVISSNALLVGASLLLAACGGGGEPAGEGNQGVGGEGNDPVEDPGGTPIDGDGETDFVSDVGENTSSRATNDAGAEGLGTGGTSATAPTAHSDASASPERAISEADIIQVDGDTLYALSQYSGLTIIDLADPSDLRVLGTYRSTAMPFEMYLDAGTAYIMYNDHSHREWDEAAGYYVWHSSSRLLALDVSDPAAPRVLGYKDLPGAISDSRKVGDIVYVVTYENGYCWDCDEVANTRVSSFDVSDPTTFAPVDQERFENQDESWGLRHVSVSQDRIYVSGYAWSSDGSPRSGSVQVVDISDPGGDIVPGAVVEIAGQIDNRWQMDEYDGVLRVISQPSTWNSLPAPVVETFAIASSQDLAPLASLKMSLPTAESLQSVRFDGTRAFAVTFERVDPLFTFDLTDPAHPVQVGELEIPGFLYHMEPRGDRLYALGFDDAVDDGALHVSIFDIADLTHPTMLDRVNFGGDWAWLAEDQDRVHKLLNLALDEGLIFMPFSGSVYDDSTCYYDYGSGIQIIDVRGDDLVLRGVAPQVGEARRALLHDNTLFGISDNAVQSFDIGDRDAPTRIDRLDVARNVSAIKVLGDDLLRFGQDWWTDEVTLDLVSLVDAESAESATKLDLSSLTDVRDRTCNATDGTYRSNYTYFTGQVFVHDDHAFVPREIYEYGYADGGSDYYNRQTMRLTVVALTGDGAPRVVGEIGLEPTGYASTNRDDSSHYAGFVQTEHALLVGRRTGYYAYDPETGERAKTTFAYDVIDLSAGADARVVSRLEIPNDLAWGGWGYGAYGCMIDMSWGWYGYDSGSTPVSGDLIASQHQEPVEDDPARVRYYLDRIDVSDPEEPVLLDPVNIPGQVLHYDHDRGLLVTVEDRREVLAELPNYQACDNLDPLASWEYDEGAYEANGYDWENTPGACVRWHRRLNSLRLDGDVARRVSVLDLDQPLDDGTYRRAGGIAVSKSRIFYQTYTYDAETYSYADAELSALGHDADGRLSALGSVKTGSESWYGVIARDNRAFISGYGMLEVVTSPNNQPLSVEEYDLRSGYCQSGSLEVVGNVALCAGGQFGVQRIRLE